MHVECKAIEMAAKAEIPGLPKDYVLFTNFALVRFSFRCFLNKPWTDKFASKVIKSHTPNSLGLGSLTKCLVGAQRNYKETLGI